MATVVATNSRPRPTRLLLAGACLVGAVAIGIAIVRGYAFGWPWTGVAQHESLWDLLHLLVLPIAVASVPIWYRTHRRHPVAWTVGIELAAAALAVAIVGGYLLDWTWTGFEGQALWDLVELLVLPLALASLPLWLERRGTMTPLTSAALAGALAVFAVLVVGGYFLGWTWTGFEDNTLWDWLGLLLVPFVVPAAITWYLATSRVPTLPPDTFDPPRAASPTPSLTQEPPT